MPVTVMATDVGTAFQALSTYETGFEEGRSLGNHGGHDRHSIDGDDVDLGTNRWLDSISTRASKPISQGLSIHRNRRETVVLVQTQKDQTPGTVGER